jgi:hypothetical protein
MKIRKHLRMEDCISEEELSNMIKYGDANKDGVIDKS